MPVLRLSRTLRFLSLNWEYYNPLAAIPIFHIIAIIVYAQLLNAFPARHNDDDTLQQPPAPADTAFITAGFVLMLTSIFRLCTRSRAMGSSFLLPLSILCLTGLSLLFALRLAIALSIPIDPTSLTHALPFLISIIGFDKPLRIAHAVFYTPYASTLHGYCPNHSLSTGSPIPLILIDAFIVVFLPIIKNYFIEIKLLAIAAYLPFGSLRPLCALAALTLVVQSLLTWTYFVSILSAFLGNCAVKMIHSMANLITNLTKAPTPSESKILSLSFLLGEKGSSLYNPRYTLGPNSLEIATNVPDLKNDRKKHSGWRLKLVIFTSFLLFNFLTPFSFSHHDRHPDNQPTTRSSSISNISRSDISSSSTILKIADLEDSTGSNPHPQLGKAVYSNTDSTRPSPSPPLVSPPNPSNNISLSLSRTRFTLSFTLSIPPPVLPSYLVLSFSLLGIITLGVLFNACLVVSRPAEQGLMTRVSFSVGVGPSRGGGGGGASGGGGGGGGGGERGGGGGEKAEETQMPNTQLPNPNNSAPVDEVLVDAK